MMRKLHFTLALLLMTPFILAQQLAVPGEYPTIQAAIDAAVGGDTIIVDEDTYNENINFMGKAITVASKFILDGDTSHISKTIIDGSQPTNPDTASTVLFISGEDEDSRLIGFTITGGTGTVFYDYQPDYGEFITRGGGGIMIIDGGATVEHNLVIDNTVDDDVYANAGGGIGIYITEGVNRSDQDSILIRHNTIKGNMAVGHPSLGGAIYAVVDKSDPGVRLDLIIQDNLITENKLYSSVASTSSYGPAITLGISMPIRDGNYIIRDNVITKNVIEHTAGTMWASGGAMYIFYLGTTDNDNSAPWIINNVMAENVVPGYGGGTSLWYFDTGKTHNPRPIYINNTIVDNEAGLDGSGFHFHCSNPYLINNIVWNQLGGSRNEIRQQGNNNEIIARHNTIQGGWEGEGNIDADPMLDPSTFELLNGSPCIGRGVDSFMVDGIWYQPPSLDLFGNARPHPGDRMIDLGAIESDFFWYDSESIINVPGEESTIQQAIDAAVEGDTVLVKPGIYYENINFKGKAITVASKYIIDGDESHIANTIINGSQPANPDTASTVLFISGEDENSCLIGFTITGGIGTVFYDNQPDYGVFMTRGGGGIMIIDGGATVEHNHIIDNTVDDDVYANAGGGIGIYITEGINRSDQDSILIRHNTIKGNTVVGHPSLGGAVYAVVDKIDPGVRLDLIIQDNLITENKLYSEVASTSSYGAAITFTFDTPIRDGNYILRDNVITKNVIEHTAGTMWSSGGGVYIAYLGSADNDNSAPWFINNIFAENSATYGGATSLYYFNSGRLHNPRPVYINNTIVDNEATTGKAFHFENCRPVLFNNIIWDPGISAEIFNRKPNEIFAVNNTIRRDLDSKYNLETEPFFMTDSWDLEESSLCVGRGTDSMEVAGVWYKAPDLDMLGNTRKGVDRIDLGAKESSFAQVDYFVIDSTDVTDGPDACDVELLVYYDGGTPPFTYYFDGTEQESLDLENICGGSYEVSVEDGDGNVVSETIEITDFVTGIPSNESSNSFTVYPNPVNGVLKVALPQSGHYSIEILSTTGQIVHRDYIETATAEIDVTGFPEGIYLVRVGTSDWSATEKIMIY